MILRRRYLQIPMVDTNFTKFFWIRVEREMGTEIQIDLILNLPLNLLVTGFLRLGIRSPSS